MKHRYTIQQMARCFKIRRIYSAIGTGISVFSYLLRRPGVAQDLEYFSQERRDTIRKEVAAQLAAIPVVIGVIDYGGTGYRRGISDIDWLIVLNNNTVSPEALADIDRVVMRHPYLCRAHPPLLADEQLIANVLRPSAFNYIHRHNQYRILYQKKSLRLPYGKAADIQKLLFNTEKYFVYLLAFTMMKKNNGKRVPLRATLKMLTNNLRIEFPILEVLATRYPALTLSTQQKQHISFMRSTLERVSREVEKQKILDQAMSQQVVSLLEDTLLLLEWYSERIYLMSEAGLTIPVGRAGRNKIRIVNSAWGRCVFVRDYCERKQRWLLRALRMWDVAVFDMQFFHYMHCIEQRIASPPKEKGITNCSGAVALRAGYYRLWWKFLKKNGLYKYSDFAPLLRFIMVLKRPSGLVERITEHILNYVYH